MFLFFRSDGFRNKLMCIMHKIHPIHFRIGCFHPSILMLFTVFVTRFFLFRFTVSYIYLHVHVHCTLYMYIIVLVTYVHVHKINGSKQSLLPSAYVLLVAFLFTKIFVNEFACAICSRNVMGASCELRAMHIYI